MKSPSPQDTKSKRLGGLIDSALFALLGALLIVVQVALAFLPNIELVSILIVVYTVVFGFKAMIPTAVFVVSEWLIYGFGLWSINYIYVWPLLVLIAYIFRKNRSPLFWALVCGIYGLAFGALCAIVQACVGGIAFGVSYWINGIPFDLLHCVGNFVTALLLFRPLTRALETAAKKIGRL